MTPQPSYYDHHIGVLPIRCKNWQKKRTWCECNDGTIRPGSLLFFFFTSQTFFSFFFYHCLRQFTAPSGRGHLPTNRVLESSILSCSSWAILLSRILMLQLFRKNTYVLLTSSKWSITVLYREELFTSNNHTPVAGVGSFIRRSIFVCCHFVLRLSSASVSLRLLPLCHLSAVITNFFVVLKIITYILMCSGELGSQTRGYINLLSARRIMWPKSTPGLWFKSIEALYFS